MVAVALPLMVIAGAPVVPQGGACGPYRIEGPTLVAFFDADDEPEKDAYEAWSDFQLHLAALRRHPYAARVAIEECRRGRFHYTLDGSTVEFRAREAGVGYFLARPGAKPYVHYGVSTDDDLLELLRGHLDYPWTGAVTGAGTLAERLPLLPGFLRFPAAEGAFGAWLRRLPLRPPRTPVRLFDGRAKAEQGGVFAVLDVDVGTRDLQQCADAVMRLRAEYLLAAGCDDRIAFAFTSGHPARWIEWRTGGRPTVSGDRVSWVRRATPDASYASFRRYLDVVFTYAGSHSLARELKPVRDPGEVRPGDVFIQGGFRGHAVLVADVAEDDRGRRIFALVQSYMPAQDLHLLVNPKAGASPWYEARGEGELVTPEWTFSYRDLRRFADPDCGASATERGAPDGGAGT